MGFQHRYSQAASEYASTHHGPSIPTSPYASSSSSLLNEAIHARHGDAPSDQPWSSDDHAPISHPRTYMESGVVGPFYYLRHSHTRSLIFNPFLRPVAQSCLFILPYLIWILRTACRQVPSPSPLLGDGHSTSTPKPHHSCSDHIWAISSVCTCLLRISPADVNAIEFSILAFVFCSLLLKNAVVLLRFMTYAFSWAALLPRGRTIELYRHELSSCNTCEIMIIYTDYFT